MPSFDIVSKTDVHEVDNALAGVQREMAQRFDFKGSKSTLEREGDTMTLLADNAAKMKQLHELLTVHLTRRKIDAGALEFGTEERAAGDMVRQQVTIRQGIDRELSKRIVKAIKDSKLKVQAAVQGDELRVSGKKLDDLQAAIALVKGLKIEQPLQYVNFRD
ncbi:YajQ family cyclic di-GMP-binding protein [Arenibaculum sp.]|jgi:hypothetical protein|uniref:YajQ family cyclic di-GMP-binding protein n=1 Tax=Arenibaculum sp. TaxID=2865862 RepID=UPI002E0F1C4B|nr:YajQ family cyclic di-GMP-binding protein [Arenibaculum sp.]